MRIRKYLKICYENGWNHGFTGKPPDPSNPGPTVLLFGSLKPYDRWAYDAGHRGGQRDLMRFTAATKKISEEAA